MMTMEQVFQICDNGYCNEIIEAYMVLAMDAAGLSKEDINKAQMCLHYVFDENSAERALTKYVDRI